MAVKNHDLFNIKFHTSEQIREYLTKKGHSDLLAQSNNTTTNTKPASNAPIGAVFFEVLLLKTIIV